MKKKIRFFASIILILLVLTSCTFSKDRNKVIKQLKRHDIITKKWDLIVETSTSEASLFLDTISYDYIYKTSDGTYNVVRIMDNEKKYTVQVEYDVYYYTTKEKTEDREYTAYHYESPRTIKKYYLNPDEKDSLFKWKMEKLSEEEKDNTKVTLKIPNTSQFEYQISNNSKVTIDEEKTLNASGREDVTLTLKAVKEGEATIIASSVLASGRSTSTTYKIKVNERLDITYEITYE